MYPTINLTSPLSCLKRGLNKNKLLMENILSLFLIFLVDYLTRWISILPLDLATNLDIIHGYSPSLTWGWPLNVFSNVAHFITFILLIVNSSSLSNSFPKSIFVSHYLFFLLQIVWCYYNIQIISLLFQTFNCP